MSVIMKQESRENDKPQQRRGGLKSVARKAERFVTRLGAHITHLVLYLCRRIHLRFRKIVRIVSMRTAPKLIAAGAFIKSNTVDVLVSGAASLRRYCSSFSADLKEIRREKGFLVAAAILPIKFGRDCWEKRRVLASVFNYAAPACALTLLIGVVSHVSNMDYAVSIRLNGENVGYVQSETDYEEAKLVMQERINMNGSELDLEAQMEITPLPAETSVVDGEQLADIIMNDVIGSDTTQEGDIAAANLIEPAQPVTGGADQPIAENASDPTAQPEAEIPLGPVLPLDSLNNEPTEPAETSVTTEIPQEESSFVEAHSVYVDGKFVGAVTDVSPIERALDSLQAPYRNDGEILRLNFSRDISYNETGLYSPDTIVDANEIAAKLVSQEIVPAYYTVVEGDCPIIIAEKNGISLDELVSLNPTLEKECFIGQQVVLQRAKSYVSVEVIKREQYSRVIDYTTETVEDNKQYKGIQTVKQKGVEGESVVTADVVYVDGYRVSETVISENIISQPVTKIVSVGTLIPSPSVASNYGSGGIFQWPVAGGYISDYFGSNRNHKGLDIAAPYGTLIFAAESGTITRSGNRGDGYGICVMMSNGNGYTTVYGHMSKTAVSVGQKVNKGDIIGYVGSTGDSSGNHLHFEVRYNGVYQNPLKFVSK